MFAQQTVNEWKQAKLVIETESASVSPCILIEKENGEQRMVID